VTTRKKKKTQKHNQEEKFSIFFASVTKKKLAEIQKDFNVALFVKHFICEHS
jgi:hypothetical protein